MNGWNNSYSNGKAAAAAGVATSSSLPLSRTPSKPRLSLGNPTREIF